MKNALSAPSANTSSRHSQYVRAFNGPVYEGSRAGAGWEIIKREATEGITGKDVVGDLMTATRNAFTTTIRLPQQIIPSILNAGSTQRFQVVPRNHRVLSGTTNSLGNIYRTAKKGNVLGTVSAVASEALDGPVDDGLNLIGGANYHVRAVD